MTEHASALPHGFKRILRVTMALSAAICLAAMAQKDPLRDLRSLYAATPQTWPRPTLQDGARFVEFAPLPDIPEPDRRLAAIGAKLFDDPKLSKSGQIACASCHARELGFSDGLRTAFGHDRQRGRRNTQSLLTAGWLAPLFWDGRTATLEAQALHPIVDGIEMAATLRHAEAYVNRQSGYRKAFREAGRTGRITRADIAAALASFERTLRPPRSRFDLLLVRGASVLTDKQLQGLDIFRGKAGCVACHNGPLLSDGQFHNIGLSFYGRAKEDLGRWEITRAAADVGRFRTPSLRAVGRTAPYMHNGIFRTLENVVAFYNAGGGRVRPGRTSQSGAPFPTPDPLVRPLKLTSEEQAALVAFLEML